MSSTYSSNRRCEGALLPMWLKVSSLSLKTGRRGCRGIESPKRSGRCGCVLLRRCTRVQQTGISVSICQFKGINQNKKRSHSGSSRFRHSIPRCRLPSTGRRCSRGLVGCKRDGRFRGDLTTWLVLLTCQERHLVLPVSCPRVRRKKHADAGGSWGYR